MKVQLVSGEHGRRRGQGRVALHDQTSSWSASSSENPARIVGELELLPEPERRPARDRPARPRRPARADPGLVGARPARLAGRRRLAAHAGPARGAARLDRRRRTPRDRRRHGGRGRADGLPRRPPPLPPDGDRSTSTPPSLRPLLGGVPDGRDDAHGLRGRRWSRAARSRPPATASIAADRTLGSGSVTLLGFDPTTSLDRRGRHVRHAALAAPPARRASGGIARSRDDSQIVGGGLATCPASRCRRSAACSSCCSATSSSSGPVNYLVLTPPRPARVGVGHGAGADRGVHGRRRSGSAALLRGIGRHRPRGRRSSAARPGTDQATAQSYLGIFSPTRGDVPGPRPGRRAARGADERRHLRQRHGAALDVLQGDPSRVRDLAVGFGSLRTVRAEASADGPAIDGATSGSSDGASPGTITNRSDRSCSTRRASSLGHRRRSSSTTSRPGATVEVDLARRGQPVNQRPLSDRVVGPMNWDGSALQRGRSSAASSAARSSTSSRTTR